jgi:hypothetical protein
VSGRSTRREPLGLEALPTLEKRLKDLLRNASPPSKVCIDQTRTVVSAYGFAFYGDELAATPDALAATRAARARIARREPPARRSSRTEITGCSPVSGELPFATRTSR